LSLEISDNGRGLSPADLAKARSFGIRGLHERAGTVGGWVDMSSSPSGTTLILSIPLDTDPTVQIDSHGDAANGHTPGNGAGTHDPSRWGEL
jgi:signal transduction histidine kinase